MIDKDRSPMEQAALALYVHAAQMIKEGKSRQEIERHLIHDKGIKPQTARMMLDKLDESRANVARKAGFRNAGFALVIFASGVIVLGGWISGDSSTLAAQIAGWSLLIVSSVLGGRGVMQILGL